MITRSYLDDPRCPGLPGVNDWIKVSIGCVRSPLSHSRSSAALWTAGCFRLS